ncbi:MAG: DNA methyltransferase [Acidobacteriota bacterium]
MKEIQAKLFNDVAAHQTILSDEVRANLSTAVKAVRNGIINKVRVEDSSVHDWYRFVLSFPPHLVREYLERFGITKKQRVLDPFCGTGTTLVECKKLRIPSAGVEANPMAYFASQVKTDWSPEPRDLLNHANRIAEDVRTTLEADGFYESLELFELPKNGRPLHTLNDEKLKLLLTDSISPVPLHKTLVLLERIQRGRNSRSYKHELLSLARALTSTISNLHFGPEVGVGKPKLDAPVISAWLSNVKGVAEDLATHRDNFTKTKVHQADSRDLLRILRPNSIDAVITSPPYPNEKDYTRTTRLESVLLGFIESKEDLRELKRGLVRSNTRNVYKQDTDDSFVDDNPKIQAIATEIERRRIEMGKTSGFERLYARVTKLYFGGMKRHLADLRQILRPGAQLAYVVGDQASYLQVMIRTGVLLAEIAESLGYEVINIDLFRTRLATATREQLREEVVLLRWPKSK